jgi:hypothetical protein
MNRYPRPVQFAQRILLPVALIILVAIGAWLLAGGEVRSAAVAFILAGIGLLSIFLSRILLRFVPNREVHGKIFVRTDPVTALRWTTEALRELAPDGELEVDPQHSAARIEVPQGWRTWGERVNSIVRPAEGGSNIEVTSVGVFPQLFDFRKNRENVDSVIRRLSSLDPEGTRGG